MFAKEVPQGKKDTKRQTSSRFNVSKNRELTRLPPLKDASVSFSILLSGLHSKNKKFNFRTSIIIEMYLHVNVFTFMSNSRLVLVRFAVTAWSDYFFY